MGKLGRDRVKQLLDINMNIKMSEKIILDFYRKL